MATIGTWTITAYDSKKLVATISDGTHTLTVPVPPSVSSQEALIGLLGVAVATFEAAPPVSSLPPPFDPEIGRAHV
jgi:hypothetical protein